LAGRHDVLWVGVQDAGEAEADDSEPEEGAIQQAADDSAAICRQPDEEIPVPRQEPRYVGFPAFQSEFFRHYEKRIGQLLALGIEADLILFHPYDKGRFGFDTMPHDVNIRFIRYCVAGSGRIGNVWWSLANEFDFVRTRKMSEWDSFGRAIVKYDPYKKLCSIHNGQLNV